MMHVKMPVKVREETSCKVNLGSLDKFRRFIVTRYAETFLLFTDSKNKKPLTVI